MSIDLTGITNKNEYYTNHYFSTIFEENAGEAITAWAQAAKSSEEIRTPWAQLRQNARQFYPLHDRYAGGALNLQLLAATRTMADRYLASLGYPEAAPELVPVDSVCSRLFGNEKEQRCTTAMGHALCFQRIGCRYSGKQCL